MLERGKLRWLVPLAALAFALAHGFAGAATHLPHHPDHALTGEAAPAPQADGTQPHQDGHGGTACEMLTGSGPPPLHPAAESPATSTEDAPVALSCGTATQARSPPKPSLAVLSVLRV